MSTLGLHALDARPQLRQALRCSRVLVTSPAAARFANLQMALKARAGQRWFALGEGTAAILHRCGIERVLLPDAGADSESLLARAELQQVGGERIGLITAPGGRGLLASELSARGASLLVAEVYQRQAQPLSAARLRALDALPARTALLVTSGEALSLLWQGLADTSRERLLRRPCVVSSDRLAEQASKLGFSRVLRAAGPRPANLLAALAAHVEGGHFR